ncbi:molybdopterin-containing oxidoreductase family protein [Longimicrobium terrae]|uniref:Anaerobic selenocysteine-containing dehydrogenase n=1 Tax=Longimicrobium terrae TaxID=1639882 RepID=A0A841H0P8_9BACT|nr:molybdopterin oxidoreductase family protein [Longimicrobium terrae]MBB4637149.1 anaerobic selenocysteine-containing dehydrogenase [Longimicrobium terrae]MBB6071590.1 anaerobic selenocysteine-containing dehydrogenase [Longimicrobium terrae]NNC29991.1 molybdopterin oxidoreductase family protein [Longimicrobium terrae]
MNSIALPLAQTGVVRGACPHDCPDTCAMLVHVQDGRAVRVQGDPEHPVTQGFLCTKVNRYVERTYHADRLTVPLRRVGPKGEGRFEPATWDEALDDIARRLNDIRNGPHGPQSILPYSYSGTLGQVQGGSMDRRFFHRIGASLLDRTICASAGSEGWKATYGDRMGPTPTEAEHARLILLWGTNTLTSNPHLWPALRRAREAGARLIAIDPIRTRTAAQCDEHLPIRPGTDAALALGMMHVIFRDGLQDDAYLRDHTVGAEELRIRAAEWTPARAAETTGLPAERIERLAHEFATTRPAFIRLNYGLQRHRGGGTAVRTVSLLPAVTGAWRDLGGGATLSTSGAFKLNSGALQRPDWIAPGTRTINMIRLGEALTKPDAGVGGPPVQAFIVYNSNPAAVAPDLGAVRAGLLRDDLFTVVMEHFVTDTARYADWVLPATSQLEHWDVHTAYGHLYLTLNQPSIAPVGQCLPNTEIFRRLASRMGLDDPEFADSDTDLIRQALKSDHPWLAGITFERLVQEGWVRLNAPEDFRPYADPRPNTPTGKIQILAPELAAHGIDPLPTYIPPAESAEADPERAARYPLMLLSPPEHPFMNSTFVNVPSLARAAGDTKLLLHPSEAGERGVAEGDRVRCWNDRGHFFGRAVVTEDVRPGVAVSYGVRWAMHSDGGRTVNDTTSQAVTDLGGGAVFYDNAVEVEPAPDRG